jgi:hypothetical protein
VSERSITGRAVLTVVDHLRAVFWSAPRFYRLIGAATLVALILALLRLAAGESSFWWFYAAAILLIAALATPAWLLLGHWRLGDAQKELTYTVDAENIATRDATGAVISVPWSLVRSCIESKTGFAFSVRPAAARWLVKRAFKTDDVGALRNLIKSKLGGAAKLRMWP